MAIDIATVWDVRANGDVDNGGGFVAGASGTDHSQQDAAWAAYTDLAIDGADNTIITSAAIPFAADDVGNLIKILSGIGFTPGWYEIVSVGGVQATLDRACGATGSTGGVGNLGGAVTLVDEVLEASTDGNIYYVKNDATHTLTAHISILNFGSTAGASSIVGYNSTHGDEPVGDDRPLVACGAYSFSLANFWNKSNLRFTTTSVAGVITGTNSFVSNCRFENSGPNRNAATPGQYAMYLNCEFTGANGDEKGANVLGSSVRFIDCYFHDLNQGIFVSNDYMVVVGCVFDTIAAAAAIEHDSSGDEFHTVVGNVFYNCLEVVYSLASPRGYAFVRNIFKSNTVVIDMGSLSHNAFFDWNIWDNTLDIAAGELWVKGPNAINGDPGFVDAPGKDFTVPLGSNAIDAFLARTGVGLVGDYKINIGVDQGEHAAAGGGGNNWW